ncbi:MAG: methionine ABC transporter ATP-binding protein, partial [Chloroflexales bacterium]
MPSLLKPAVAPKQTAHAAHELLRVVGLKTHFFTEEGVVQAVDGVDFTLQRGET